MMWLLALAAALMPSVPLVQVSASQLAKARSYWLLGLLTVGIVYLAHVELWLALMGLIFLCRWRSSDTLPTLVTWVAIGLTWFLLLKIPPDLYRYVAIGWLAIAVWQVVLIVQRWWVHRRRIAGSFGSPPITAMFLAVVVPLSPWWLWPVLAIGLFGTSSIGAAVAVSVSLVWLYPWVWPYPATAALVVTILWALSPWLKDRRIFEWTLRGDTLDSWHARWFAWRVIAHEFRRSPTHWALGHGPNASTKVLRPWASRLGVELPHEVTNEALQHVFEYGVIGGIALLAFLWRVVPSLVIGDPWSAAWVGFAMLTWTHWPCRHPTLGLVFLALSAKVVLG